METQKIVNLLNDSEELNSKFATIKWYIINNQNNGQYGRGNENENGSTIKFETKVIKPSLCDYPDTYILLTGHIKLQILLQILMLHLKLLLHLQDVQHI